MGGRVKYYQLSEKERKQFLGDFYTMISLLKTREEVKKFFKDLLTLSEVVMISRRLQIAKMLLEGKTYEDIKSKLGVGSTTIARVERWLDSGFGGYKEIIERFKKASKKASRRKTNRQRAGEYSPLSFTALRKKYPLHFLLFNLLIKD